MAKDSMGLGDHAQAGLAAVPDQDGSVQPQLDGMNYTKVKFVGMSFDSIDEDFKIGDEVTFTVKTRCIGLADDAQKRDGSLRHTVKMDVQSVVIAE